MAEYVFLSINISNKKITNNEFLKELYKCNDKNKKPDQNIKHPNEPRLLNYNSLPDNEPNTPPQVNKNILLNNIFQDSNNLNSNSLFIP